MDREVNNRNAQITQDVKRDNTDEQHRRHTGDRQTRRTQETDTRDGRDSEDRRHEGKRLSVGIGGGCWDRWRCSGGLYE